MFNDNNTLMSSNYSDNTINGKCSGCGKCCTNVLTLSDKEIARIKDYIKKNNIVPKNHCNILMNKYSNICPFLGDDKRCKIYTVRPEICKRFICNNYLKGKWYDYSDKKVINMLSTFSPESIQPNAPDIDELNIVFESQKRQTFGSRI